MGLKKELDRFPPVVRSMGLPARLSRCRSSFAAVLCLCCVAASYCNSTDAEAIEPLALPGERSTQCFEDGQVYGCCEGAYRLNPSGIIGVPPGAVDDYCGGACVVETADLLSCVANAMDGFRFHNGASVEDVRYALRRGCSHTVKRGDFNDIEPQIGDYPDIYGDYGSDGHRPTAPLELLAFLGGAWLLGMAICC